MSESEQSATILIRNVRVFDGVHDDLRDGHVLVEGTKIAAVSGDPGELRPGPATTTIDGGGRVLMPGLSDAHVHIIAAGNTQAHLTLGSTGLPYLNGLAEAGRMLMRGFTTVRDMAGDTVALKQVIDAGVFAGPRIYPSQAAISQTSGHGDFGPVYDPPTALGGPPARAEAIGFMRVADGRDRVLAAVREQLKKGASQIKVMAGGGIASPYDPLDVQQFTPDELRAAVEAAADWGTYVAAHVYTSSSIQRAVDAGVRSIEHGHLADEKTIALMAEHDVWLSTQPFAESDHAPASPASAEKNRMVCAGVERTFAWAREYGVKVAFGTDLLLAPAESHRQSAMLTRLARHFTPVEALKIATSGNAELFRMAGERDPYREAPLGVIAPGAWADLLVVDGDPTQDLAVLADPGRNLAVIIKGGRIHKNTLTEGRAST